MKFLDHGRGIFEVTHSLLGSGVKKPGVIRSNKLAGDTFPPPPFSSWRMALDH
jgi:hypothetical protein